MCHFTLPKLIINSNVGLYQLTINDNFMRSLLSPFVANREAQELAHLITSAARVFMKTRKSTL